MSKAAPSAPAAPRDLTRFGYLSLAVALVVFAMKLVAFGLTGSVGLLSDAVESTVNIVAALVAIVALRTASRPGDSDHHYGHGKAEYFSALVEGVMIFVAAVVIIIAAVERLRTPQPLDDLGLGLAVSALASVVNGATAMLLIRAGRQHRSIVLVADGKHLMTGCLDLRRGDHRRGAGGLHRQAGAGSADRHRRGVEHRRNRLEPDPAVRRRADGLRAAGGGHRGDPGGAASAGQRRDLVPRGADARLRAAALRLDHILVPGQWTVQRGHDYVSDLEAELHEALDDLTVQTHLEPREDPRSWDDIPPGGLSEEI